MTEREEYVLKRRKKKIRLRQIATAINVSQSLLSQWETGTCGMSKSNERKYKEFIDGYAPQIQIAKKEALSDAENRVVVKY